MKKVGGYSVLFLLVFAIACSNRDEKKFRLVPSAESGIKFKNTLHETVDINIFNYMYFYNGGGVAIGDVNGDDLLDIFFTSNQESEALYLNLGALKFKDITEPAGVGGFPKSWTTGVTMADVNSDGRLDIYVSYVGEYLSFHNKNQLFINEGNGSDGVPRFSDRAGEFGLDLVGFSTQAAFFDYDLDGDLDMFMLNHSLHQQGTFGRSSLRGVPHALAGDKLMRNDGGHFVDATLEAGIYSSVLGYGLGVVVSDVNLDGFPDLYVGNDFHENDYLYINQRNGTFKELLDSAMQHTSRYTMGVDFADFNNDLFPDLMSLDMLPADPTILKSAMAEDPYEVYNFKLRYGYNHQFTRNALQLNNHNGTFSDVALLSGVSATDWSWATFFADFDLDGNKDIFIANGIARRSNDLDYINFIEVDSIQGKLGSTMGARELRYIEKMPRVKISNFLYVNNADSTFTDRANEWGLGQTSYSNGAAYADLDNDGDLDIVVNNIEDEAMLYENKTIHDKGSRSNFLQVALKGNSGNTFGLGAKIFIYDSLKVQIQECMPTRGYQSSVDYRLTFGLANATSIDSLIVVWNTGEFQKIKNVKSNQKLLLDQANASGKFDYSVVHNTKPLLVRVTDNLGIDYAHRENTFAEFNREQLIPHMMSTLGPAFAVADITGDGREDIFLGGAKRQAARIFIQTSNGKFQPFPQHALEADSVYEDVDAKFFDVDGDHDQDLFVVSGGNEYFGRSSFMMPRLYLNDGHGNFSRSDGLPDLYLSGACLSVTDVDRDGDFDVFLGARTTTGQYGVKPDSYLLVNDGRGHFENATEKLAPQLKSFGFVRHALWADIDNDDDNDLLIAAEWSPITIFVNESGKLTQAELTGSGLESSNGWWNCFETADFDSDGDLDIVAGNLGLNSKLKASVQKPVRMYVADFDQNDSIDQILSHYVGDEEYPFYTRDEMTKQMPSLKKRYLSYRKFAETNLHEMFPRKDLEKSQQYSAFDFQTSYIENLGNLKFRIRPMPKSVQFSTTEALLVYDVNHDSIPDLFMAGNYFPVNVQRGRYDASYGWVLIGKGDGTFDVMPAAESGLTISGETRALGSVMVHSSKYVIAVRNNSTLQTFTLKK